MKMPDILTVAKEPETGIYACSLHISYY